MVAKPLSLFPLTGRFPDEARRRGEKAVLPQRGQGEFRAAGLREKRAHGRYFTAVNLFDTPHFRAWAENAGLPDATLVEPFAGRGDLVGMLSDLGLCRRVRAYDVAPASGGVERRDTLADFPRGRVVVTNPPWLARNSATRRGLPFPETRFDDLYKHSVDLCLRNADHVAAIIPASFLSSGLFRGRLLAVDVAAVPVFRDTENPTCLALFAPDPSADVVVYHGGRRVGKLSSLEKHLPNPSDRQASVRFNEPNGRLGLVAIDNTREASIRFCKGGELSRHSIGATSRMITRIAGNFGRNVGGLVDDLNEMLNRFRRKTDDVFLTPFKGLRKDGKYRRRLDFARAREFVLLCRP